MKLATNVDVIVVGAGPAGLSAARVVAQRPNTKILVCEREEVPGGIPRHCYHTGWGIRDLRRNYSGPAYAKKLTLHAMKMGVTILTETSVRKVETEGESHVVQTVSPRGLESFRAPVVIMATGCRESTRHARLMPGKRPLGIFSTGSLQQLVFLKHIIPGKRAVVFGSEHVSLSAILTLKHAGMEVVAMIEPDRYPHSYSWVVWFFRRRYHFPLLLNSRIARISGNSRLTSITVEEQSSHQTREIPCDTLIVTGGFKPETTLALESHLSIDYATEGVQVDSFLQTDRKGIFACGNILHGAETGDIAALEGRWAGEQAKKFLDHHMLEGQRVRIICESPIAWISPGTLVISNTKIPSVLYTMRVRQHVRNARVYARCNGEIIWQKKYGTLAPNRRIAIPVHTWIVPFGLSNDDVIRVSIE